MSTTAEFFVWKRPVDVFNANHRIAFHTWVTTYRSVRVSPPDPADGAYWYCMGGSYITDPLPTNVALIHRAHGDLDVAKCLSEPNKPRRFAIGEEDTGVRYGIDGVCHQIANRVLAATGTTIPQDDFPDYAVSVFVYGVYGASLAHRKDLWEQRQNRCGVQMEFKEEDVLEQFAGDIPTNKLAEFRAIKRQLDDSRQQLTERWEANTISADQFMDELNQVVTSAMADSRVLLGEKTANDLFGPARTKYIFAESPSETHPLSLARHAKSWTIEQLSERAIAISDRFSVAFLQKVELFREKLDAIDAVQLSRILEIGFDELLPQSKGEFAAVLGESEVRKDHQLAASDDVDDARLELGDFLDELDPAISDQMIEAWRSKPPDEFRGWIDSTYSDRESEFERVYLKVVALTCLLQDHGTAADLVDHCVQLAADESSDKKSDAKYLAARNRWYRKDGLDDSELSKAVQHLSEALQATTDTDLARKVQCRVYLARIAGHRPDLVDEDADDLLDTATTIANLVTRTDVKLLCAHAKIVRLRLLKRSDESLDLMRDLLDRYGDQKSQQGLLNSIRASYGIALRNQKTTAAREEAIRQYNIGIHSGCGGHTPGMLSYLKADVLVDEMHDEMLSASAEDDPSRQRRIAALREEAIQCCRDSIERLSAVGDPATMAMANRRLAFLTNTLHTESDATSDSQLINEQATRSQQLVSILLGDEYYNANFDKSIPELQNLLSVYFENLNIVDNSHAREQIDVNNILDESSLLCLGIPLKSDLVVFVYSREGEVVKSHGYFSLTNYSTEIRPTLSEWISPRRDLDTSRLLGLAPAVWQALQSRVSVVKPLDQDVVGEKFSRVTILAPLSDEEWVVPFECLPIRIGKTKEHKRLIDLTDQAVIYANSTRRIDVEQTLRQEDTKYIATTQQISDGNTVFDAVQVSTSLPFERYDLSLPSNSVDAQSLVLIGHSEKDFWESLAKLDLSSTRVFMLLMCSATKSQARRGPISQNVSFSICNALTHDSVLVVPRIAVTVQQACRFAEQMATLNAKGVSVARAVRDIVATAAHPYDEPWLILS
ncbi:MAG: hypothetical protein AAGG48_27000 [Planctomycetota bacterium]